MIPEMKVPGSVRILKLREATVSDAMDFSEVNPEFEEAAITGFLDRLQDHLPKEERIPAITMTADQRQTAMYWYYIHNLEERRMPLDYGCPRCGNDHSTLVDMLTVASNYKDPAPETLRRPAEFLGQKLIIKPLIGSDLEAIEKVKAIGGTKALSRALVERIMRMIELDDMPASVTLKDRETMRNNWIVKLSFNDFKKLAVICADNLELMEHGIETEVDQDTGAVGVLTPPQECPNKKGETTRIRVTFRAFDAITRL